MQIPHNGQQRAAFLALMEMTLLDRGHCDGESAGNNWSNSFRVCFVSLAESPVPRAVFRDVSTMNTYWMPVPKDRVQRKRASVISRDVRALERFWINRLAGLSRRSALNRSEDQL